MATGFELMLKSMGIDMNMIETMVKSGAQALEEAKAELEALTAEIRFIKNEVLVSHSLLKEVRAEVGALYVRQADPATTSAVHAAYTRMELEK